MFYLVPESGTRQKLVPDCMTHVRETGTVSGTVSGQYVMDIMVSSPGWCHPGRPRPPIDATVYIHGV